MRKKIFIEKLSFLPEIYCLSIEVYSKRCHINVIYKVNEDKLIWGKFGGN
jgi:ferredoxin-fold anticodon binding domain-containing protein